jgi:hypothetical protein
LLLTFPVTINVMRTYMCFQLPRCPN